MEHIDKLIKEIATKYKIKKYGMKNLRNGFIVEKEHNNVTKGDPKKTLMIVIAHLKEKKNYYDLLRKIEK